MIVAWLFVTADASVEQRLRALEEQNKQLQQRVDDLSQAHASTSERVDGLMPLKGRFSGYLDVGFFYVQGDGSGIRSDANNRLFPEYAGRVPGSWVFYGDPLATMINARGEPASTAESRAITFDPVRNAGRASFIVNAFNFEVYAGLGESLSLDVSVDFVPRGRNVSNPSGLFLGDFLDVKLAFAEYIVPIDAFDLRLQVGKFESVLGIEYRRQDSPDRLTVTPSLICRYTCGRPVGLKARARFLDERLVVALTLTNGTNFSEYFPFYNEIDMNFVKTGSGRLSYTIPVGAGLELGVSGSVGAQDYQNADNVLQWHVGADLRFQIRDFEVAAEYAQGRANGRTLPGDVQCGAAPCLSYKGAYGLVSYRVTNWFTPYVRVDWREALHLDGASFVYVSNVLRPLVGVSFPLGEHVIVKAEYIHVRELGGVPQFSDDVLSSAVVVRY